MLKSKPLTPFVRAYQSRTAARCQTPPVVMVEPLPVLSASKVEIGVCVQAPSVTAFMAVASQRKVFSPSRSNCGNGQASVGGDTMGSVRSSGLPNPNLPGRRFIRVWSSEVLSEVRFSGSRRRPSVKVNVDGNSWGIFYASTIALEVGISSKETEP